MPENRSHQSTNRKRLKERFKRESLNHFDNCEILELLLSFTGAKKDVKALAKSLIAKFGSLKSIFDAEDSELKSIKGMGENGVVLLKLAKEVSGAYLKDRIKTGDFIKNKRDALSYLKLAFSGDKDEKFLAMYLNLRNELLSIEVLHEGPLEKGLVYPRKAIELAFRHNANSIVFVHSHPLGEAVPTNLHRQLAKVLDRAAMAVDLIVLDHLIIGKNRHFSARENGWAAGNTMHSSLAAERSDQ